jgi:hypothetical protein
MLGTYLMCSKYWFYTGHHSFYTKAYNYPINKYLLCIYYLLIATLAISENKNKCTKWQLGHRCSCVSSGNQGPCWDMGDKLGWGKALGRAETSAPWSPSRWRLLHAKIHWKKRQAATPTLPPPHHRPARPPPCRPSGPQLHHAMAKPASAPQAHWAATCLPTNPPAHRPLPTTGGLQHLQMYLQTCLGDTDKQDWMLKE